MCPLQEEQNKKGLLTQGYNFQLLQVPHCKDLPISEPLILDSSSTASTFSEEDRDAEFDKAGKTSFSHSATND